MDKYEVAQILREIGTLIELTDANPKKGISYRKAARTIESIPNLSQSVEAQTLESFPGIGKSISKLVTTLVQKGYLPYYNHLKNSVPASLLDLCQVPGLGSNKVRILYEQLNITTLVELEQAIAEGKLSKLRGFGPAYIAKIQKQISLLKAEGQSLLFPQALGIAQALVEILLPHSQKLQITGELRRKSELISLIEIIAITNDPEACLSQFTNHGLVKAIVSKENKSATVLLKHGIKAHLSLCEEKEYPLKLLHTTGNHTHLAELNKTALEQGFQITDNSLDTITQKKSYHPKDENQIYKKLGLAFIPPEVREGYGEIEAAKGGYKFPLVELKDLQGTFHCHTLYSDGHNTLEEMATAAKELGWHYIGIADHSKSSYQANGMSEERILEQIEQIRQLNQTLGPTFQVFAGVECDILKDGQLDFDDEILKELDYVIVSAHRYFKMEEEEMTQRFLKAIEHPYTTMVGHLTGRLLRHRDPYKVNVPKIIDACIANGKIIELNAYPNRLDMDWRWWIKAKEKGLKCCINPDAHSLRDLLNCAIGVNMARKGWLEKHDVVNTYSLKDMRSYLKQAKPKG